MKMFTTHLKDADPAVFSAIEGELERQQDGIELIASENIVSKAVMEAQGSVMTNKYAEGYTDKRYYGGCECVDATEKLAIERACKLFECNYANVQPHSGSGANQGVFMALLEPGDKILGMALDQGGHLTHGSSVNQSGKWFQSNFYGIDQETGEIDYDEVMRIAKEVQPKLIIAGYSAYPRKLDFKKFREIADNVGAYLMADIAHIAGLVATGYHESPFEHCDVVTTTTHKTLRGPRGGMIMTNDEEMAKKFNSAIFPGMQGGPLEHVIAAKAVAFGEALQPEFKSYVGRVVKNNEVMGNTLMQHGIDLVTGGTDNHLLLVDVTSLGISGKAAEHALEEAGLTCNKNSVPNDTRKPWITSGIRLGSAAATSRGFGEEEFVQVGRWINEVLRAKSASDAEHETVAKRVRSEVKELCQRFPIYETSL